MVQKQWCDGTKAVMGTIAGTLAWSKAVAAKCTGRRGNFHHAALSVWKEKLDSLKSVLKEAVKIWLLLNLDPLVPVFLILSCMMKWKVQVKHFY